MEINYNELFGVEPDEGAEVQEVAEPVTEEEPEGVEEQEVAEPADEPAEAEDENAKYAAARRKAEAERDEAIARASAERKRTVEEILAMINMEDPYNGRRITTEEELAEYRRRHDEERSAEFKRRAGMDDGEYKSFVDNLPEVRAAREAEAAANYTKKRTEIEEDLKKIQADDPTITSFAELTKTEGYKRISELYGKGLSLHEAYKLVNYDKMVERAASASKQAAINAARSKSHLTSTAQRGTGGVDVPADVMAQYRFFMPDATAEEIRKHYNKSRKK
jgi:hypothetical protein